MSESTFWRDFDFDGFMGEVPEIGPLAREAEVTTQEAAGDRLEQVTAEQNQRVGSAVTYIASPRFDVT